MGKSTISMAIFNGYVNLPEGSWFDIWTFTPPPHQQVADFAFSD